MKILIVAATDLEIRPLLHHLLKIRKDNRWMGLYRLGKLEIDVLITGIGMVHTAFHLGKTLTMKRYDIAINAGIAGVYDFTMELGKVVHVTRECITELGTREEEKSLTFYKLDLTDPDVFPYRSGFLFNEKWPDIPALRDLPRLTGNTVNQIHSTPEILNALMLQYPAEVETMEGAAFLYGCLVEGIPCAQIRSFSNYVQESDKSRWNIHLAVENLNKTVIKILQELCL